ncbi:MAG: endonuclease/exonuclease/phosphatase family protein [Phycisphaerae bacterium]|nr:endonuclease/exonuclease/phosphatase family protein [Phycisphaerae bacterium]
MNENTTEEAAAARTGATRFLWPSWSDRKRMLLREVWFLVLVSYPLIAFAYLWPQDYRNVSMGQVCLAWTAFMIRTFLFHLGLVCAVIAIVSAWRRSWRLFAATLPLLAMTLGPSCWSCRPRLGSNRTAVVGETVRVMSVNLLALNRTVEPILAEIAETAPEILLLQEYTPHWHEALQESIGSSYPHAAHEIREDCFGAAVYSKRPFVRRVTTDLGLGTALVPQMRAVVRIDARQVAICNLHLLPPRTYSYTVDMRGQFADLLDRLGAERLPVIMAGDFNFTEASPNAAALGRLGMADAQDLGGWGRGATWPVQSFFRYVPGLRLDHVYLRGGLTCTSCRTGIGRGSDHRPVIVEIGFAK